MDTPTRKRLVASSSTTSEGSRSPRGPYPILEILKEKGIPATRANYLALMDPTVDPEEQLDPEVELELPPELRFKV